MTTPHLLEDLKRDEGCRHVAYEDTVGVFTIGYGHAHVAPGTVWTQTQCDAALADDVRIAQRELDKHAPWWRTLCDARQDVMVMLTFNMGWPRLSGFHDALTAMQAHDYARAAAELLDSRWASQVKGRAVRLAEQMRTGLRAQP